MTGAAADRSPGHCEQLASRITVWLVQRSSGDSGITMQTHGDRIELSARFEDPETALGKRHSGLDPFR